MSVRAALRGVGWVVSELVPWQGLRCLMGHDFDYPLDGAEQLAERESEEEVSEPRCQCLGCGGVDTPEHECQRPNQSSPFVPRRSEGESPQVMQPSGEPAGVDTPFPPRVPPAGPDLAAYLEPAILEVLSDHRVAYFRDEAMYECFGLGEGKAHAVFGRYADWTEHVTADLAPHIVQALRSAPK